MDIELVTPLLSRGGRVCVRVLYAHESGCTRPSPFLAKYFVCGDDGVVGELPFCLRRYLERRAPDMAYDDFEARALKICGYLAERFRHPSLLFAFRGGARLHYDAAGDRRGLRERSWPPIREGRLALGCRDFLAVCNLYSEADEP